MTLGKRLRTNERCALYGVEYTHINARKVYERDGYTCWLCGHPCDGSVQIPDLFAPTLDHVTPLAQGGHHVAGNVRTAHYSCNSSRQDTDPDEWRARKGIVFGSLDAAPGFVALASPDGIVRGGVPAPREQRRRGRRKRDLISRYAARSAELRAMYGPPTDAEAPTDSAPEPTDAEVWKWARENGFASLKADEVPMMVRLVFKAALNARA